MNLLLFSLIHRNFGFVICIVANYSFWCVIEFGNRKGKKIRGIDNENLHSIIFVGK